MRCGFVALVGRPNVGKSTLLNQLIGQKLCITSRKPQTTRHRIHGIKTFPDAQVVYVDTPGIHSDERKVLNRYLNRTAKSSLSSVDLVVWLTDVLFWHQDDAPILASLKALDVPVIFAINKVDRVEQKDRCLPFIQSASEKFPFEAIVPVSALREINLDILEQKIIESLPEGTPIYPSEQISDRQERFFAAEIIREKLIRRLAKELPYELSVEIERYSEQKQIVNIHAIIWVAKESQKSIVIGKSGRVLKTIGYQARMDLQRMVEKKVFLELWVKVKRGWSDNERAIKDLGYE